jgi:hypothetical protein
LYCRLFTNLAVPGWTSHVLVGSFFGAINALGISILGEYVVRIYDQVRARPLYLIDRTVNMGAEAKSFPATDAAYDAVLEETVELMQLADQNKDDQNPSSWSDGY